MNFPGNLAEMTTPYHFSAIVLSKGIRQYVDRMIDLSITLPDTAAMTAEQIFLGGWKFMGAQFNNSNFGPM